MPSTAQGDDGLPDTVPTMESGCVAASRQGRGGAPLLRVGPLQVRHNDEALEQLITDAQAIPSLSQLLAQPHPPLVQEQVAQLLGLLTSRFLDARKEAVTVRARLAPAGPGQRCKEETGAGHAAASTQVDVLRSQLARPLR